MTDMDMLFQQVKQLSSEQKQQLMNFLQLEHTEPNLSKNRVLGLNQHLGNIWMSDDFDDELPDSFWLGDDE